MWVKICGVTRIDDVNCIAAAGADALGLNFFPGSRRFLDLHSAAPLASAARRHGRLDVVGVFVNSTADQVLAVTRMLQLDVIQFHGDETPELVAAVHAAVPGVRLVRAVRVSEDRLMAVADELQQLKARVPLFAVLVDAFVDGQYGGTGNSLSLGSDELKDLAAGSQLILAGGLTHSNVCQLARKYDAWGVDTAGGVESSPGIKDAGLVSRFVRTCRVCSDLPAPADQRD